ncbi:MAG: hypothetical protein ACI9W7_000276 [Porticoccaceae bacterium]|jgi:hypothetical protein
MEKESVRFQRANFVVDSLDEYYRIYYGVLGMSLTFGKSINLTPAPILYLRLTKIHYGTRF